MTSEQEDTTQDLEIIENQDEFDRFESWVMGLGEESAIQSQDPDEQQAVIQNLQQLVGQAFPAGVDGSNAIESLKGIIDDPQLQQQIKAQSKEDENVDVRGLIQGWLELYAPEALEQLDFGDFDPNAQGAEQEAPAEEPEAGQEAPAEEPQMASDDPKERDEEDDEAPFDADEKSAFKKPNNPNRSGMDSARSLAQKGMKMNVQEVAEFIHSFYDKESGTFPKGPEGVVIMVGKKFGEQAEMVARKMVERMAPQQQDPQIAELARIRELSGMTEAGVGFKEGDKVVVGGKNPATIVGQDGDTYFVQIDGQSGSMAVPASQLTAPKAAATPFQRGDTVMYQGKPVTYIRPFGKGEQSYVTVDSGSDELVDTSELTKEAVQSDEISRLKELLRF